MSKIKVAINGFGRIGRVFTRALMNHPSIELIAINDLVDTSTLAHLLKYDSVHGKLLNEVSSDESSISIDGKPIKVYSLKDPEKLPWGELEIDIVIESTGVFRSMDGAK